jgi:hypothetical protein
MPNGVQRARRDGIAQRPRLSCLIDGTNPFETHDALSNRKALIIDNVVQAARGAV